MNDSAQHQEMSYLERANVRRLAATVLRRRAQLLEAGGDDAVASDILELSNQTGCTHRDAATMFLNELDTKIAEARQQDQRDREQHRQRLSAHSGDIQRLMAATGQGRSTIANLEKSIKGWDKRQEDRLMKLRNAGLTEAQIEDILGNGAELAERKRELAEARLKLANDEAEFSALQDALRHGRDHSQTVAA